MIGQLYETYDFIPDEILEYVDSWFSNETNSQSNESD